jgi:hypothetical protein
MRRRPAPDRAAAPLELIEGTFVNARLRVDDVGSGVEARALSGSSRRQPFVEDAGDDSQ